jgi:hypothetical protein
LKDSSELGRDRLTWKWLKGEATGLSDLGDPLAADAYALCIYDESGDTPETLLAATAPPGGTCRSKPCWRLGERGLRYRDADRTPDGLDLITSRIGEDGKAKFVVKGKGDDLPLPALPLPLPIRVQLLAGNGECWEATYSSAQFQTNTPTEFDGKAD